MEPAIKEQCKKIGYPCYTINKAHFLDASEAGKFVAGMANLIAAENQPFSSPCVIPLTGEKIVKVGKNGGVGGRNQEFALAAASVISGQKSIVIASANTDGTDRPVSDFDQGATAMGVVAFAGGIVDGYSMQEVLEKKVDILDSLKTHATSKALWDLDNGIWTSQNISMAGYCNYSYRFSIKQ